MSHLVSVWFAPILAGIGCGISAMILHEAGHAITAIALGVNVKRVGLRSQGIFIVRETGTRVKDLLISLAGPSTNVMLCLIFHRHMTFALANLCFAVCNLLPISGSDGERALACLRRVS